MLQPNQHFNVGSTLFQRLGSSLKQRWSEVENETKSDVRLSRLHSVGTTSVPDVETMSKNVPQRRNNVAGRWYNVVSMLFQPSVDVSWGYVESNQASEDYGFVNRWVVFILLN